MNYLKIIKEHIYGILAFTLIFLLYFNNILFNLSGNMQLMIISLSTLFLMTWLWFGSFRKLLALLGFFTVIIIPIIYFFEISLKLNNIILITLLNLILFGFFIFFPIFLKLVLNNNKNDFVSNIKLLVINLIKPKFKLKTYLTSIGIIIVTGFINYFLLLKVLVYVMDILSSNPSYFVKNLGLLIFISHYLIIFGIMMILTEKFLVIEKDINN